MKRKIAGGGIRASRKLKNRLKFAGLAVLFLFTITCSMTSIILAALTAGVGSSFSIFYEPQKLMDDYGELYNEDTQTFNQDALNTLLREISGDANSSMTNMAKINELAATNITAADMRAFDVSKTAGEDITVTLGGFKWTATYLQTTESGDVVLTLWLTGEPQEKLSGEANSQGFLSSVDGRLFSVNRDMDFTLSDVINMDSTHSPFALFSIGGLSQFIEKAGNNFLWIPSRYQALGVSYDGLTWDGGTWGTSRAQRKNTRQEFLGTYGAYTWVSDEEWIGDGFYAYYILCSEQDIELLYAIHIGDKGDGMMPFVPSPEINTKLVVRPAFNLNLTKVAQSI